MPPRRLWMRILDTGTLLFVVGEPQLHRPLRGNGRASQGSGLPLSLARCATSWEMDIECKSVALAIEVSGADFLGVFPNYGVEVSGSNTSPTFTFDECLGANTMVGGLLLYNHPTPVVPDTWGKTKACYRSGSEWRAMPSHSVRPRAGLTSACSGREPGIMMAGGDLRGERAWLAGVGRRAWRSPLKRKAFGARPGGKMKLARSIAIIVAVLLAR